MSKTIFFSAGGTGGHIYPALALADDLKNKKKDLNIVFITGTKKLEKRIFSQSNYDFYTLPIYPLKSILNFFFAPFIFLKALFLILKYRPVFVLGTGAYVSFPVVFLAALIRKPTFILELNTSAGIANRVLSAFVKESFIFFEEAGHTLKSKKLTKVQYPLRNQIQKKLSSKPHGEEFRILVVGGSQGSHKLNQVVSRTLPFIDKILLRHQTGVKDFQWVQEKYKNLKACAYEYFDEIEKEYDWADLVIARSGAGTLAELAATGKAALLIPLPFVAEDHQTKNAQTLCKKNAVEMLEQKNLNPESLRSVIESLKQNPERRKELSENIYAFYKSSQTQSLSDILLKSLS